MGCQLSDDRQCALAAARGLKDWFGAIGSPVTLSEAGIPASDIPAIAANAVMLAQKWRMPAYSAEVIANILQRAA